MELAIVAAKALFILLLILQVMALGVFFEIRPMTPSQPLIRARQFVFHFSSHGSWADISVNSNGDLSSFA